MKWIFLKRARTKVRPYGVLIKQPLNLLNLKFFTKNIDILSKMR